MKTLMQETIEDIEKALNITISDEDKSVWLEKERQQIIDAYNSYIDINIKGDRDGNKYFEPAYRDGHDYYNIKFNNGK